MADANAVIDYTLSFIKKEVASTINVSSPSDTDHVKLLLYGHSIGGFLIPLLLSSFSFFFLLLLFSFIFILYSILFYYYILFSFAIILYFFYLYCICITLYCKCIEFMICLYCICIILYCII
jgi:hypothetical protein